MDDSSWEERSAVDSFYGGGGGPHGDPAAATEPRYPPPPPPPAGQRSRTVVITEEQISREYGTAYDHPNNDGFIYRFLQHWTLTSSSSAEEDGQVLPLPVEDPWLGELAKNPTYRNCTLTGSLVPVNSSSSNEGGGGGGRQRQPTIRVELTDCRSVAVEYAPHLRGYWVQTSSSAWYWLRQPSAEQRGLEWNTSLPALAVLCNLVDCVFTGERAKKEKYTEKNIQDVHSEVRARRERERLRAGHRADGDGSLDEPFDMELAAAFKNVLLLHMKVQAFPGLTPRSGFMASLRALPSVHLTDERLQRAVTASLVRSRRYAWGQPLPSGVDEPPPLAVPNEPVAPAAAAVGERPNKQQQRQEKHKEEKSKRQVQTKKKKKKKKRVLEDIDDDDDDDEGGGAVRVVKPRMEERHSKGGVESPGTSSKQSEGKVGQEEEEPIAASKKRKSASSGSKDRRPGSEIPEVEQGGQPSKKKINKADDGLFSPDRMRGALKNLQKYLDGPYSGLWLKTWNDFQAKEIKLSDKDESEKAASPVAVELFKNVAKGHLDEGSWETRLLFVDILLRSCECERRAPLLRKFFTAKGKASERVAAQVIFVDLPEKACDLLRKRREEQKDTENTAARYLLVATMNLIANCHVLQRHTLRELKESRDIDLESVIGKVKTVSGQLLDSGLEDACNAADKYVKALKSTGKKTKDKPSEGQKAAAVEREKPAKQAPVGNEKAQESAASLKVNPARQQFRRLSDLLKSSLETNGSSVANRQPHSLPSLQQQVATACIPKNPSKSVPVSEKAGVSDEVKRQQDDALRAILLAQSKAVQGQRAADEVKRQQDDALRARLLAESKAVQGQRAAASASSGTKSSLNNSAHNSTTNQVREPVLPDNWGGLGIFRNQQASKAVWDHPKRGVTKPADLHNWGEPAVPIMSKEWYESRRIAKPPPSELLCTKCKFFDRHKVKDCPKKEEQNSQSSTMKDDGKQEAETFAMIPSSVGPPEVASTHDGGSNPLRNFPAASSSSRDGYPAGDVRTGFSASRGRGKSQTLPAWMTTKKGDNPSLL